MNNTTEVSIVIRGKLIDTQVCQSMIEAERYKTAVRQWGRENGVLVSVMTKLRAASEDQRHWLLPAQAC